MKQWSDEFCMGIKDIDSDHKEMFDMINRLYLATKQGKGSEEVGNVLAFLEGYVQDHFSREEEYMDRYHYPGTDAHKSKHRDFISEFLRVRDEFNRDDTASYLSLLIEGWLYSWLDDHFIHDDKALGKFLKAQIEAIDELEKG